MPSRFLLAGVVVLSVLVLLLLMRVGPGTGAAAGPGPTPPHRNEPELPGRRWRLGAAALAGALVALDPVLVRGGRAATGTVLAVVLALGAPAPAWGARTAGPALADLPWRHRSGAGSDPPSPAARLVATVKNRAPAARRSTPSSCPRRRPSWGHGVGRGPAAGPGPVRPPAGPAPGDAGRGRAPDLRAGGAGAADRRRAGPLLRLVGGALMLLALAAGPAR